MNIYFSNYKAGICLLLILLTSISMTYAARGNSETNQRAFHETFKKQQPKSKLVKKLLERKTSRTTSEDKSISNGAIITIVAGVLALSCLFLPLLVSFGTSIWLLGMVLAIVGDIFGIRTLRKIKRSKNPEQHASDKTITTVGLVMALLTGIIPLLLLLIVLLTL